MPAELQRQMKWREFVSRRVRERELIEVCVCVGPASAAVIQKQRLCVCVCVSRSNFVPPAFVAWRVLSMLVYHEQQRDAACRVGSSTM